MNFEITIVGADGQERIATAKVVDIKFGTVRKLMQLVKVDDIDNTYDLLHAVMEAWDEIKIVLAEIFPDVTEEEMDSVKLSELIPSVMLVLKQSFAKVLTIPSDSKNGRAE